MICDNCGTPFLNPQNRKHKRFCSRKCCSKHHKNAKFPSELNFANGFEYYRHSKEWCDYISKIKTKYNFSEMKVGEVFSYKFSDYDKTHTRGGKTNKPQYMHIACSIVNCAKNYSKKNNLGWHFIQKTIFDKDKRPESIDITRVK